MALKNDWATDDYYAASDANAVADTVNAATNNGIINVAPPTGVAATDTAAIQAAIDAAPAGGADIIFQAGTYYLTTTGVTTSKRLRLRGVGAPGINWSTNAINSGTILYSASATAQAITSTADGLAVEDIYIFNGGVPYSGAGSPTAGWGIKCTNTVAYLRRCWVNNYYDCFYFADNCQMVSISECMIGNPMRYGVFLANPTTPDGGDNKITGNWFLAGYAPTSGIRWESGGGLRVSHNKFNGLFDTCIDCALAAGAVTVDLFIHDNSIEAMSSPGNTGIKFARQTVGSGSVSEILVLSNEFMFMELCVDYGPGFSHALFDQNIAVNCDANLTVRAGAGSHTEGTNLW